MRRSTVNHLLATVLVLLGLGLWGLSGLVTYRGWPTLKAVVTQPPPMAGVRQQCTTAARALGFEVERVGRDLHVSLPKSRLAGLKAGFANASVLIPMCDNYRLQSFCAGSGCGPNALFLSLVAARGGN